MNTMNTDRDETLEPKSESCASKSKNWKLISIAAVLIIAIAIYGIYAQKYLFPKMTHQTEAKNNKLVKASKPLINPLIPVKVDLPTPVTKKAPSKQKEDGLSQFEELDAKNIDFSSAALRFSYGGCTWSGVKLDAENLIFFLNSENPDVIKEHTKLLSDVGKRLDSAGLLTGRCIQTVLKGIGIKYGLMVSNEEYFAKRNVYVRSFLTNTFRRPVFFRKVQDCTAERIEKMMLQLKNDIIKLIFYGFGFNECRSYHIAVISKKTSHNVTDIEYTFFDENSDQLRLFFPGFENIDDINRWKLENTDVDSWIQKNKDYILTPDRKAISRENLEFVANRIYSNCKSAIWYDLFNEREKTILKLLNPHDKDNGQKEVYSLMEACRKKIVTEIIKEVEMLFANPKKSQ